MNIIKELTFGNFRHDESLMYRGEYDFYSR